MRIDSKNIQNSHDTYAIMIDYSDYIDYLKSKGDITSNCKWLIFNANDINTSFTKIIRDGIIKNRNAKVLYFDPLMVRNVDFKLFKNCKVKLIYNEKWHQIFRVEWK